MLAICAAPLVPRGCCFFTRLGNFRETRRESTEAERSLYQQVTEVKPEPIHILVTGGSVTAGINCFTGIPRSDVRNCAWSARLETFINGIVGFPAVRVTNRAVAGSNSATGVGLLKYRVLEDADVLINAYSTNDMHVQTVLQASQSNQSLREVVFDMSQEFARLALSFDERPLLLWVDDYLGNEQLEIMATTELSQGVGLLASYYGFSFLSYANMVRDIVYGDTREALFSPGLWYKKNRMQREIHPSQGMHMATTWLVAHHLMTLLSRQCTFNEWKLKDFENSFSFQEEHLPPGMPPLKGLKAWPRPPNPKPQGLPPRLTSSLSLAEVTDAWIEGAKSNQDGPLSCPFKWVSGINPIPNIAKQDRAVQEHFHLFLETSNDWILGDDSKRGDKIGWIPRSTKPFIAEWNSSSLDGPIGRVGLFYLKSYGERWQDSTVRVEFEAKRQDGDTVSSTVNLAGFHDKRTSEMYLEEVTLPDGFALANGLRISLTLTKGKTFKLMGLALCN